ncbi:MAG: response regulator [Bdellovibrionales bacterium]|nr:response regulator [Bdellovibrionales bacterium]
MSDHNALYRYLYQQKLISHIPQHVPGTEGPLRQLEQAGLLSEIDGLRFLGKKFHMKHVDWTKVESPELLPSWDTFEFPTLWAQRVCPIEESASSLTIACCNPFNSTVHKALSFQCGKTIELALSPEAEILVHLRSIIEMPSQLKSLPAKTQKNRVLVIDDDPDIRDLLGLQLYHENYQVDSAKDGNEGLAKVYETNPDLVLLDLRMPECSGEEFLKNLRTDSSKSNLPVIVYTAVDSEENEITLLKLGAIDFVSKGASKNVLASRIKKALA